MLEKTSRIESGVMIRCLDIQSEFEIVPWAPLGFSSASSQECAGGKSCPFMYTGTFPGGADLFLPMAFIGQGF